MKIDGAGGNQLLNPEHILKDILRLDFGSRVADLGCGSMAYFTLAAAHIVGKDGQVYAVDILKDVLSSVQSKAQLQRLDNIKTVWSNLEIYGATQVPTDLDYVFLVTTLFQNTQHLPVLKEAARVLKEGGKMLLVEWLPQNTAIGPALAKRLKPEQIKAYTQEAGFKLQQEFKAGSYHYGMIFEK
ncbi:MAG: class I SAM-dependent methyltransferase [Candidatus Komeilibacteria bacterium]